MNMPEPVKKLRFRQKNHHTRIQITRIALPEVDFRVVCSKGTYIRSLAYDFGKALNSGAHLTVLRGTKIGNYDVKDAMDVTLFEHSIGPDAASM
jgi:tRNA pseudouridine55 synthase